MSRYGTVEQWSNVARQSSSSFVLVSADRTDSSCGELLLDLLTLFEDENEDEDEDEQEQNLR